MRKSRFTETQTIGMIKEQEAGMPTAEVCADMALAPRRFTSSSHLKRFEFHSFFSFSKYFC